jgi:hypothetical protein
LAGETNLEIETLMNKGLLKLRQRQTFGNDSNHSGGGAGITYVIFSRNYLAAQGKQ